MANLNTVTLLYETFKQLNEHNQRVRELILASTGEIYLPHTFKPLGDARSCVASALTDIWFTPQDKNRVKDDAAPIINNVPHSGLLCASAELIAAVEDLNRAKANFKTCVVALRDADTKNNVKFQFTGYMKNDPVYQEAMRRVGIGGLDLVACYRNIKVLDENLHAVRWVWQIKPKGIEKRQVQDLLKSLENNAYSGEGKSDIREMLFRILSGMNPTDYVAEVKSKLPKLRANLVYLATGADPSTAIRKPIACSGVLLTRGERLPPNIAWKDMPDRSTKERWSSSSTIEPEPFVAKTKLHFYKDGCMPSPAKKVKS